MAVAVSHDLHFNAPRLIDASFHKDAFVPEAFDCLLAHLIHSRGKLSFAFDPDRLVASTRGRSPHLNGKVDFFRLHPLLNLTEVLRPHQTMEYRDIDLISQS